MNFALSAIILVILLLPGAFALLAYYTSFAEKKSSIHVPFNDLLLKGLVISFVCHSSSICILRIFNYSVKFDFLYGLVLGKDEKSFIFTNEEFTSNLLQFTLYNFVLLSFVTIIVKYFKRVIQSKNFDIDYFSLRNTNYWFHIFSGRYLEGKSIQGMQSQTDLIWIDALIDNEVIYSGFLVDFNYSPQKDELENIILREARKRICNHTSDGVEKNNVTSKASEIPGDIFVLPMEKMVNLNIYYLNLDNIKLEASPVVPIVNTQ